MIYLSIVSILEFILIVLLGWIFYVQQQREKKLEQIADNCVTNFQSISDIIERTDEVLSSSKLKEAFSTDDETGIFFRQMTEIQDILNNFKLEKQNGKEEVGE